MSSCTAQACSTWIGPFTQKSRIILLIGSMALTPMLGCSSSTPDPHASNQAQVLASFDLSKCESMGSGLYKCPAVDKPLCDSTYVGDMQCVKVGKKGSVFVMAPTETP